MKFMGSMERSSSLKLLFVLVLRGAFRFLGLISFRRGFLGFGLLVLALLTVIGDLDGGAIAAHEVLVDDRRRRGPHRGTARSRFVIFVTGSDGRPARALLIAVD